MLLRTYVPDLNGFVQRLPMSASKNRHGLASCTSDLKPSHEFALWAGRVPHPLRVSKGGGLDSRTPGMWRGIGGKSPPLQNPQGWGTRLVFTFRRECEERLANLIR